MSRVKGFVFSYLRVIIQIKGYWGISTQGKRDLIIKNIPVEKLGGITSIHAKVVVE
jgi:hypothetical protein